MTIGLRRKIGRESKTMKEKGCRVKTIIQILKKKYFSCPDISITKRNLNRWEALN